MQAISSPFPKHGDLLVSFGPSYPSQGAVQVPKQPKGDGVFAQSLQKAKQAQAIHRIVPLIFIKEILSVCRDTGRAVAQLPSRFASSLISCLGCPRCARTAWPSHHPRKAPFLGRELASQKVPDTNHLRKCSFRAIPIAKDHSREKESFWTCLGTSVGGEQATATVLFRI